MALPNNGPSKPVLDREVVLGDAERRRLFAVVWTGCLLFLCGVTLADPDLWGHTLYGLRCVEQGILVERTDPFSYTAYGAPWVNHEWLTERVFAECWSWGGNPGLTAWRNLCVLTVFGLMWRALRRPFVSLHASWLLVVFTTECLANYVVFVRPQLATYVGVLGTVLILRRCWNRLSWTIWCVPAGMIVWCNLHGGFLAGIALTGLFTLAAAIRGCLSPNRRREVGTWLAVACATVLATLVNPYGYALHQMLWDHLVTKQFVLEWQPVWAATPSTVYAVPFLIAALSFLLSRRWDWVDLLLTTVVGWQAASHIRHIALFCLVLAVLLPIPLSDALGRLFPRLIADWSRENRRWWRWTAAGLILTFLALLHVRGTSEMWQDGLRPWDVAVETRSDVPGMPVSAVMEIKRRGLLGNLATDYGWGQFVLWHLWPNIKVAFDGRYRTVFPTEIEQMFVDLQSAGATGSTRTPLLDDYRTDLVLAPAGGGLEQTMLLRADWEPIYQDPQSTLFAPRQPELALTPFGNVSAEFRTPRWVRFPGLDSASP